MTETGIYKIKTKNFEGPFYLLLSLIRERKLLINDLSLAQVTEDYLNYVNQLKSEQYLSAGERFRQVSDFIVVAATLILIKSKSLLPDLDLSAEEESSIHNLENRLKLYEFYLKLAEHVKNRFGKKIIFPPLERKNDTLVFLPDDQISKGRMMTLAHDVLDRIPKKISLPEVPVKKVISIEEMIRKLTERIQNSLEVSFKSFSGTARSREERVVVIIGFLAMLEMVRQGILHVTQESHFKDIIIKKNNE